MICLAFFTPSVILDPSLWVEAIELFTDLQGWK